MLLKTAVASFWAIWGKMRQPFIPTSGHTVSDPFAKSKTLFSETTKMSLLMKTLKEDDAIIIIRYVVPGLELDIWPNIFQCENIFDKKFPF